MARNFFGRIASALSRLGKSDEHAAMTKRSTSALAKAERSSARAQEPGGEQATTGRTPERAVGSVSPAGGSTAYSPGAWRGRPMGTGMSDHKLNSASKGTGRNARTQAPRRNPYESEESPTKGLWTEPSHERLSDPFSERPSQERVSRPSAESIH